MTKARIDDRKWKRFLVSVEKEIKNPVPILKTAYATIGFRDIVTHFGQQKGPEGRWQKRSEATQKNYAEIQDGTRKPPRGMRRGSFRPTNKLLQLTGNLRKNFLTTNVKRRNNKSVTIFNNAPYSGIHDRGGRFKAWGKKNVTMPKRQFMYFSGKAMNAISRFFLDQITKG